MGTEPWVAAPLASRLRQRGADIPPPPARCVIGFWTKSRAPSLIASTPPGAPSREAAVAMSTVQVGSIPADALGAPTRCRMPGKRVVQHHHVPSGLRHEAGPGPPRWSRPPRGRSRGLRSAEAHDGSEVGFVVDDENAVRMDLQPSAGWERAAWGSEKEKIVLRPGLERAQIRLPPASTIRRAM